MRSGSRSLHLLQLVVGKGKNLNLIHHHICDAHLFPSWMRDASGTEKNLILHFVVGKGLHPN